MADRAKRSGLIIAAVSVLLVAVFALSLFFALTTIGDERGEIKTSRSNGGSFASAGAPRSQLALKQMFDAMGSVRTNGNRTVYEPITEEYLAAVRRRIEEGERPMLSVEEILYIISDSALFAEKYDGVRLSGEGTLIFGSPDESRPAHISALEKSGKIFEIILFRIQSLCTPEAFEYDGNTVIYYPDGGERSGRRKFVFYPITDSENSSNIVFFPGDGQRISLYPSADSAKDCNIKYMLQSEVAFSESERAILAACGYDPDRCRNVTPEYWRDLTECKLAVSADRIIVIDPTRGSVTDSAPKGMRTVSHAIGDGDGDGTYELYFTFFANGRGGVTAYLPTEGETEILFETDRLIGAFESLDGRSVEFYYTEQLESDRYLNLLHRVEKIIIQKESKG